MRDLLYHGRLGLVADPGAECGRLARMDVGTTEEALRLITETISEVFWISPYDMSRMIYISPAYERIWGRSCESLYADPKSYLDAIHPDDVHRVLQDIATERFGEALDQRYRVVRPDGTVRWIWNRGYPVRDAAGAIDHYVGWAQDITDLATLAERFQLMSRATDDAIWDWDMVTNVAWWSDAFFDHFGYDRAVAPGRGAWSARLHPDDLARVTASFADAIERGAGSWSEEYRLILPGGTVRDVFDRAYVLKDDAGKPVRMLGTMMDLTERRHLEAQLRQAQKMEAVGQLASGIAHDFNNILQAVILQLGVVGGLRDLPRAAAEHVRDIHAALDRAASLTRQLMVFSRREQMQPRWIDLNEQVGELARMLRRLLGEDIVLSVELAPGALPVLGDAGMIDQVIMNIAVNSRDAMPHGGTLSITSSAVERGAERGRRSGRYACVSLRDSGTGIAPDAMGHLFEPFFTTKEPGRGTGLGLAIAFGIVEQHGGWIDVETEVGRGTVFRTYLPLAGSPPPAPDLTRVAPAARGHETLLVVEDDALIRRVVRTVLEEHGYRVVEAEGANQALRAWDHERGQIDLVLTDVIMPGGMDGRELATQLAARCDGVRVIFVTGYSRKVDVDQLGPHERLLHKPITAETLLMAVRASLDER
jgi:PAS domain S-box-containing protein